MRATTVTPSNARDVVRAASRDHWRVVLLALAAAAAALCAHAVDPAHDRWLPRCPFHELTGLWCPICGSTRAAAAIAHGDVLAALRHNALFLPTMAMIAWLWASYALRVYAPSLSGSRWARGPSAVLRRPWLLVAVVVAFAVFRNVPGLPSHLLSR